MFEIKNFSADEKLKVCQDEIKEKLFEIIANAIAAELPEESVTRTKDYELAIGAATYGDVELPFTITVGSKTPIEKTLKNGTVISAYNRAEEGASYQKTLENRAERAALAAKK